LRNCDLDSFPDDVFEGSPLSILGVVYADDLASFGFDTSLLQGRLDNIVSVMRPFNLLPNAGKTQVLLFVTPRRLFPLNDSSVDEDLFIDGVALERISSFKYLGIHLDFLVSPSPH
jgi:hypothetical protein